MTESMYNDQDVKAQLKTVPRVKSAEEAFSEILKLAADKREHLLFVDCNAWLEIKMKAIAKLARRGKKLS